MCNDTTNNNKRIVVTSESLGPGSVLLRRETAQEKRNVFSRELNTATESLLTTVFGSDFAARKFSSLKFSSLKFTHCVSRYLK